MSKRFISLLLAIITIISMTAATTIFARANDNILGSVSASLSTENYSITSDKINAQYTKLKAYNYKSSKHKVHAYILLESGTNNYVKDAEYTLAIDELKYVGCNSAPLVKRNWKFELNVNGTYKNCTADGTLFSMKVKDW